ERVVPEVAARERCGLIVMGAGGPSFAGVRVSTIGRQLLRRAACSVLVVKSRPRGPYRHLLVGTDFTAESCRGLETAAAWFADAELSLMHVLDIPYRSMLLEAGQLDAVAQLEHDTMARFVAGARLAD